MLNIISRSINDKKIRGPKKVVANLILGLEKIGYPYVINKDLDSCKKLWIHDDVDALYDLKKIKKDIAVLIGPNLFVNPENIPKNLDLSRAVYLEPSINVKDVWEKRGYNKSPLEVWPVGIDTEKYLPSGDTKDIILIYFKNRKKDELESIENLLQKKNIKYETIIYGNYQEENYSSLLKRTKYIIWLGIYESQGIALLEALSSNIPIIVIDNQIPQNKFDINGTSAPYFDERCGIIIKNAKKLESNIDMMEKNFTQLSPRNFVIENLEVGKQAEKLLDLYEKYFSLHKEDELEKIRNNGKNYKIGTIKRLYQKIQRKIFYG